MSIVAKRSPISSNAELLLIMLRTIYSPELLVISSLLSLRRSVVDDAGVVRTVSVAAVET